MIVVGISGEASAGKDSVYLALKSALEEHLLKSSKLSFARRLKDLCSLLFYWDRVRLDDDFNYKEGGLTDGDIDPACAMLGKNRRQVMQEVGTEAMRERLHDDVWIICTRLAIDYGEYDDYDILFVTDCRFMNEIQFIRSFGSKSLLIKVEAEFESGEKITTAHNQHTSETEWKQWNEWDYVFTNRVLTDVDKGKQQLADKAKKELIPLILERVNG